MKILITSPEAYHARLREAFSSSQQRELTPLFVPLIRTERMAKPAAMESFLRRINTFHYVICASRMAVRVLAEMLAGSPLANTGSPRLVAIGKDQDALRQLLHVEPALQNAEPSLMGIVRALTQTSEFKAQIPKLKVAVLLPAFEGLPVPTTITRFMDALVQTDAQIESVACYQTVALPQNSYADVLRLVEREQPQAIALTSGGEAHVLARLLRFAADEGTSVHLPIYSYGPYTTRCAQEAGLTIAATSPTFGSFDDFVAFLNHVFLC